MISERSSTLTAQSTTSAGLFRKRRHSTDVISPNSSMKRCRRPLEQVVAMPPANRKQPSDLATLKGDEKVEFAPLGSSCVLKGLLDDPADEFMSVDEVCHLLTDGKEQTPIARDDLSNEWESWNEWCCEQDAQNVEQLSDLFSCLENVSTLLRWQHEEAAHPSEDSR